MARADASLEVLVAEAAEPLREAEPEGAGVAPRDAEAAPEPEALGAPDEAVDEAPVGAGKEAKSSALE